MEPIRFAPIIRVSTDKQEKQGESLTTQTNQIKEYVANLKGVIPDICWRYKGQEHATPGFEREKMDQLLSDASKGIFDAVICYEPSRWSRDNLKNELGLQILLKNGIRFFVGTREYDLTNKNDRLYLALNAVMNQYQAQNFVETVHKNRVNRAKRKVPTAGSLPYGREYHKDTDKWTLVKGAEELMKDAAERYLKGESMLEIARSLNKSKSTLIAHFRNSGDTWIVNFKGEEPIVYKVPRLLPDDTIKQVIDRIQFNRRNNRTDIVNKYVLAGFLRCNECYGLLTGVTQINYGRPYVYYKHVSKTLSKCTTRPHLSAQQIERAVFETLFEALADVPALERAMLTKMPDANLIKDIKAKIRRQEKAYVKVVKDLDKLTKLAIKGTLSEETIKSTEQNLLKEKARLKECIEKDTEYLKSLPDVEEVKQNAEEIRRELRERFGGKQRLKQMTFNEKREFLHWLFDGKDRTGCPYGIYITKRGKSQDHEVDYFIYSDKIWVIRTLKGDDIDYMGHIDEEIRKEREQMSKEPSKKAEVITRVPQRIEKEPFIYIDGIKRKKKYL